MFESRPDAEAHELTDTSANVSLRVPGDAESKALVGDLGEAPVVDADERDESALRASPVDESAADDSGAVRIPRQSAETDKVAQNGKAVTAAGSLSLHDLSERAGREATVEPIAVRGSGAEARYELGLIPLDISARDHAASAAHSRASRQNEHEVATATAAAWHRLGEGTEGGRVASTNGLTAALAVETGVSSGNASAGLMQATLLRLNATTAETRTSSRGQGTDQSYGEEPRGEAAVTEATGKGDKVSLTLQLNQLKHELTRTDRPLTGSRRVELEATHDRTLGQLRDQMREERLAAREATSAELRAYFQNTGQDPETLVGQMLYGDGQDHEEADSGPLSRDEVGAMALASYAGLRGLSPLASFPDHAPSELDILAIDAADKEHAYVSVVARHGVDSRRASTALDAAYEADRTYAQALHQALAAEQDAKSDTRIAPGELEINPLGN